MERYIPLHFSFMKSYPSITKEIRKDINIIAFAKLDGSLFRAEWSPKKGFYKFGTKKQLIDETSQFGETISIFKEKYAGDLEAVFTEKKVKGATCFFEFYGENSFAGTHQVNDKKTLTLFDVCIYKQGFMPPKEFIKTFKHLDIADVLYEGKANYEFCESVRNSILEGMPLEGVIAKGVDKKGIVMFKIKSKAWLDKLKHYCGSDDALYKKLE